MKTILSTLMLTLGVTICFAQDVNTKLDQAKAAYGSGNLDDARFELQSALVEIDKVIGAEILSMLPTSMKDLAYVEESDNVTGTGDSFAGLYVSRTYGTEENTAEILIISDSPLLAGVNALLSMPAFMLTDENQKRIKVDGYKAILKKNKSDDGAVSWDVQVPFGSSLLTFTISGAEEEAAVVSMANTIPVTNIAGLTK